MELAIRTAHLVPNESSSISSATSAPRPLPKNLEASEGNRRISPTRSLPAETEPERPIKRRRRTTTTLKAMRVMAAMSFFWLGKEGRFLKFDWLVELRFYKEKETYFGVRWGPVTLFFKKKIKNGCVKWCPSKPATHPTCLTYCHPIRRLRRADAVSDFANSTPNGSVIGFSVQYPWNPTWTKVHAISAHFSRFQPLFT